jgi:hypothetical protein
LIGRRDSVSPKNVGGVDQSNPIPQVRDDDIRVNLVFKPRTVHRRERGKIAKRKKKKCLYLVPSTCLLREGEDLPR